MSDQLDPIAAQRIAQERKVFTSELSVAEFSLLELMGCRPLGFVMGTSIYHVGWNQTSKQNMELQTLTQAMYSSRELAMARMQAEADALGADGIVNVNLDWESPGWGEHLLEFKAFGTAIKGPEGTNWKMPSGRAFTSDLNVEDFYRLVGTGHVPVAFVLGTCVYHIAVQSLRQMWNQAGQNQELPVQTQGLYEAREIAMSRMEAEAERDGATGVVGVRVNTYHHLWESHITEFLALGTSIRRFGEARLQAPSPIISM